MFHPSGPSFASVASQWYPPEAFDVLPATEQAQLATRPPATPLRDAFTKTFRSLVRDQLQDLVRARLSSPTIDLVALESHIVNRLMLDLQLGGDPEDSVSRLPQLGLHQDDVAFMAQALAHRVRPVDVALAMARHLMEGLRQGVADALGCPAEAVDPAQPAHRAALQQAIQGLQTTYPGVLVSDLLEDDAPGGSPRLRTDPSLAARSLLQALEHQALVRTSGEVVQGRGHHGGTPWHLWGVDDRLFYTKELRPGGAGRAASVGLDHLAQVKDGSLSTQVHGRLVRTVIEAETPEQLRTLAPADLRSLVQVKAFLRRLGPQATLAWVKDRPLQRHERRLWVRAATSDGHAELLKHLLAKVDDRSATGASVLLNAEKRPLTHGVVERGDPDVLRVLLDWLVDARERGWIDDDVLRQHLTTPVGSALRLGRGAVLTVLGDVLLPCAARGYLSGEGLQKALTGGLDEGACVKALDGVSVETIRRFHGMVAACADQKLLPPETVARLLAGGAAKDLLLTRAVVRHRMDALQTHLQLLADDAAEGRVPPTEFQALLAADQASVTGWPLQALIGSDGRAADLWLAAMVDGQQRQLLTRQDVYRLLTAPVTFRPEAENGAALQLQMAPFACVMARVRHYDTGIPAAPMVNREPLPPHRRLEHWGRLILNAAKAGALDKEHLPALLSSPVGGWPLLALAVMDQGPYPHEMLSQMLTLVCEARAQSLINDEDLETLLHAQPSGDPSLGPVLWRACQEGQADGAWRYLTQLGAQARAGHLQEDVLSKLFLAASSDGRSALYMAARHQQSRAFAVLVRQSLAWTREGLISPARWQAWMESAGGAPGGLRRLLPQVSPCGRILCDALDAACRQGWLDAASARRLASRVLR